MHSIASSCDGAAKVAYKWQGMSPRSIEVPLARINRSLCVLEDVGEGGFGLAEKQGTERKHGNTDQH